MLTNETYVGYMKYLGLLSSNASYVFMYLWSNVIAPNAVQKC